MNIKSVENPNNPSREKRYELLKKGLKEAKRLEDFDNIISLLAPPIDINKIASPGQFKGIKIGIIGAGLAGLSACYELRKLGFDITIYESSKERVGGRVYTYYFDKLKKLYGELGPMRIPVSHEATWKFIDLFKLDTNPYIQDNENAFIYVKNTRTRNNEKDIMRYIYPKFNLTLKERKIPISTYLKWAYNCPIINLPVEIRKELLQVKKIYDYRINNLDFINSRKAFQYLGLTEDAINLVQSVASFESGIFYYSLLELLRDEYSVNFSYLYEITGGFSKLPEAFYNSLTSPFPNELENIKKNDLGDVKFNLGCEVTAISKTSNKITLEYNNKFRKYKDTKDFDFLICAIPFSKLRNVKLYPGFSNRKMQAIREVNYPPAQKTLLLFKERFWETYLKKPIIGGGSFTDLPITSVWYPSPSIENNKNKPGVLLASYNFSLDAVRLGNIDDNDRIALIIKQLEFIHNLPKGYLNSILLDFKTIQWNTEENFLGGFCYMYPEQSRIFTYSMGKPEYNKRIYFAGEHISTTHAWQQGALKTGLEAANQLAKYCKYFL
ncbi:MAG: FAD-dependent oxidoreductase [Firmicutes bacterium]|nr:FAD-dependent oxidoreductase [Bacillota bacterium]